MQENTSTFNHARNSYFRTEMQKRINQCDLLTVAKISTSLYGLVVRNFLAKFRICGASIPSTYRYTINLAFRICSQLPYLGKVVQR